MIYVPIKGRIGNNLFQISAAANLSTDFVLCITHPSEEKYIESFKDTLFRGITFINGIPSNIEHYKEPFSHFNKIPYQEGKDIILDGYFQSYKYFNEKDVQSKFAMNEDTKRVIEELYGNILKGETTSINIRRGDYLKQPHRHPFCGIKFYRDAINFIGKDKNFIISSDDINWCKKKFIGKNFHFVENSTPLIDLYIQTVCNNNIISNSTFSWWGAFLNLNPNKIVIVPSLWYGIDCKGLNTKDLFPPSFIILKNRYSIIRYIHAQYLYCKNRVGKFIPFYYSVRDRYYKFRGIKKKTMYDEDNNK